MTEQEHTLMLDRLVSKSGQERAACEIVAQKIGDNEYLALVLLTIASKLAVDAMKMADVVVEMQRAARVVVLADPSEI